MNIRSKLAGAVALIAISSAFAQVKLNDTVTVSGWATGSYQNTKPSPGTSFDSVNLDAALLGFTITPPKTPVTGYMSVYYRPSAEGGVSPSGSEATILDAYLSWAAPGGAVTITAGKFLSYLGYESFYQISDNMISLANQQFLAPIPGYHEGIKLDFAVDKTLSIGGALVDSLYNKPGYNATEGDAEFKHSAGFEGYFQYTGINNLTVWGGIGYQTKTKPGINTAGIADPAGATVTVYDLWASYQLTKTLALAAEEIYKEGGLGNKGSNWLAYLQYNFSDPFYTWFCVSGEDVSDGGPSYTKYSVAPTYNISTNLAVRAQYSYTKYKSFAINNANYFGLEMLFKF